MRTLVAICLLCLTSTAFAADEPLAAAWQDLLSADEAKATRAACVFAAKPKEGIEFLAANLRPLKVEPKRIEKLVAELGGNDFATREAAQQELEYLGKFAKLNLASALKETSNAEAKERLAKLLGRIEIVEKQEQVNEAKPANPLNGGGGVSVSNVNGKVTITVNGQQLDLTPKVIEKLPPPASWSRAARAIGILEFAGTPEAVRVLESISLGEDNAPPTKLAQDALARLKRKK